MGGLIIMPELILGFINIFKLDGNLLGGAVYEEENKAEETGKLVKGYLCTIPINNVVKEEETK